MDTNIIENNDWTTHHLGDWTGNLEKESEDDNDTYAVVTNECPNKQVGYAEETYGPVALRSSYAGYQFSLGVRCKNLPTKPAFRLEKYVGNTVCIIINNLYLGLP